MNIEHLLYKDDDAGNEHMWYLMMYGTDKLDPIKLKAYATKDGWYRLWYHDAPGVRESLYECEARDTMKSLFAKFKADSESAAPRVIDACNRHGVKCTIKWRFIAWSMTLTKDGSPSQLKIGVFEDGFEIDREYIRLNTLVTAVEWVPSLAQEGLMFDIAKYALLLTPQNLVRVCASQRVMDHVKTRAIAAKLASILGLGADVAIELL